MKPTIIFITLLIFIGFAFFHTENNTRDLFSLETNANHFLEEIKRHESKKDASCWTTLRKVDAFTTGRELTSGAVLLKIEVLKSLIFSLWIEASKKRENKKISATEIKRLIKTSWINDPYLSLDFLELEKYTSDRPKLESLSRSSENWRSLLSILQDYLINTQTQYKLLPLSSKAMVFLSKIYPLLNKDLLEKASLVAEKSAHIKIEPDDIKSAFQRLSLKFPIIKISSIKNETISLEITNKLKEFSTLGLKYKLASLTKYNTNFKVKNIDKNGKQSELLNKINQLIQVPFSPVGFDFFTKKLVKLTKFILDGNQQIGTDINMPFTLLMENRIDENNIKIPYISLVSMTNLLNSLFPSTIQTNGDVIYTLASNLIYRIKNKSPPLFEKLILKEEKLDALRDTTLPWLIIKMAFESNEFKPIDPFALEYLSEKIVELSLVLIKKMEMVALFENKDNLYPSHLKGFENSHYYFTKEEKIENNWSLKLKQKKKELLQDQAPPYFLDVTKESGISSHTCLRETSYKGIFQYEHTHEYIGSGLAIGDINGDDLVDFFYPGEGCNQLYQNLGNGKFKNITLSSELDISKFSFTHQALFADINNDSLLDLFVVDSNKLSRLFIQTKDNKFIDITESSNIKTSPSAHTASFFDFNNDGLLDLYIGHYGKGFSSLSGLNGTPNQLYQNLGNGKFKNITKKSQTGSSRWTMAVAAFDFNNDGLSDLYAGNANGFDELYINQGNGKFIDKGREIGLHGRGDSMNASFTDLNNDGFWDLYVTVIDMFSRNQTFVFPKSNDLKTVNDRILNSTFYLSGNQLFLNKKGKSFITQESLFEPGNMGLSWSANFFDYENDGDEDLYITNGYVDQVSTGNQTNLFYLKDGKHFFRASGEITKIISSKTSSPESFRGNSRSCASIDIDNDGYLDLIVTNYNKPLKIFKNISSKKNRWIKIKLKRKDKNIYGIGSTVEAHFDDGKVIRRMISAGSNYLSQDDTTLTFGIGDNQSVKSFKVLSPGKQISLYEGPYKGNQIHILKQKSNASF